MTRAPIVLAIAAIACGGKDRTDEAPRAPVAAPTARAAPVPGDARDPWAGFGLGEAPDGPSLVERKRVVDAACPAVTGPYFFAIAKAGKTSYILGTRHVSVALDEFPPTVRDHLRAARLAVFEVDPKDDKDSPRPPTSPSLKDQLGAALWAKLVALVGPSYASELEHAKPSEATVVLMAMYEDPTRLLEQDLQREAAERKIPTQGLETSKFQDELLDKLIDLRMLKAGLANTSDRKDFRDETERDLKGYCGGTDNDPGMDPKTKADLLKAGYTSAELAAMDEQLVYARNRDWIPKLEKLFAQGDVFVAVGADHLIGDRGVIALLAKDGYATTRITR